ncbi:potassium channel family protein [Candidatus Aenigmatarchaeota archaeon]
MQENVKDLLEELKDLSQLMMDLAYSSVFFKSKEIANEVSALYERLEELEEKLYLHLFAASRGRAIKRLISVIDLVESSKTIATAAKNLSQLVLEGKQLHPVIKQALRDSDEGIAKAMITKKSKLCRKKIGELRLRSETGGDIIAIRRKDKKWVFAPDKNTKLHEGDSLICMGPTHSCKKLRKLASGEGK